MVQKSPDDHDLPTQSEAYTERLTRLQNVWWKKLLPVQAPYRWNIRRVSPGRVLDVGCGLGRNLFFLAPSSVGVDHNEQFVAACRQRGAHAVTAADLEADPGCCFGSFDSILLAHVVEHVSSDEADELLRTYLPCLRPGGVVHLITPMERGHASDPTHVRLCDFTILTALSRSHGLAVERVYSFPFPRAMGRLFVYNEFNVVARRPH